VKPIIRRQADTARHKAEFTREEAKDARDKAEIAKRRAGATGRYVGTTSHEDDEAVRKAEVAKTASIQAAAFGNAVDTITISLDLVVDCLRLSMYFFHPIQQCAQQIYHTALPLSPISSQLRKSYLQSVADNRLSHVTAFLGAPDAWGLRLRTIDIKSRQLTCIATPAQEIIIACEDIVDIYDAVTFVLRQSLRAPETVTKIQGTSDGSILFFAHSYSVTMWDVQTGGLTYTFTTQSEITDIAVSMGGHIACGSSDGLVTLWNIYTKEKGEGFGDDQPVVAICWLSPREFGVATQCSVYVRDISVGKTSGRTFIPGRVWGMVCLPSGGELLVGASQPGKGAGQELSSFEIVRRIGELIWVRFRKEVILKQQPQMYPGLLLRPTLVGEEIVCITLPSGVQSFHAKSHDLTSNPPLLNAATSVAVSLKRNLVAQTEDSIQIFTLDVLKQGGDRNHERVSHVYPLGEKHIICRLQPNSYPTVFELGTLRKLHPNNDTWPLRSLPTNKPPRVRASFSRGLVAEFGISVVQNAWRSGAPLPEWTEAANEDVPLSGLSPDCTHIVTFYGSPRWELRLKRATDGAALAKLPLERNGFGTGKVYDVAFDSNTRFHLKIDGPGQHFQVPYDIIPSPSRRYSPTITKRKPMPLSEPREAPPYTLDANCEWVVDAESRKICWVSPGNVRRGNGGHFWAGLSLVMVGDDGVVRKLSFREPDS
jgi:WD40 repeat protein